MNGFVAVLVILFRIIGVIVCSKKAEELNRSKMGWGVFGFLSPILAMIWIQFMKPIMKWDRNIDVNRSN
ncbi:hypothetical protein [Tenacibaculum aquimarinum]|uniref:hypothetical protein n=1 Tax=Tenacibaculum aquimarinum TaxID=2910675 RepID=UPI001F0B542D|nr:hypothetical protein [Tenacibaculum aquimarinum]MCH3884775.1 hypothetical protein [Tenacibaculum aquimarinum]